MPFWKNFGPEFWYHQERVAGKTGQQYIFRGKWVLLFFTTCMLTLIPMMLSTYFFYRDNKTVTTTDLLLETEVMAKGISKDIELFFDQYITALRFISAQYTVDQLKNKAVLHTIFGQIQKTRLRFSNLNLIDEDTGILACCDNDSEIDDYELIKVSETGHGQDHFLSYVKTKKTDHKFVVGLRLRQNNGKNIFLTGGIDRRATDLFLEELKVKDIVDVYILGQGNRLLTPSVYFNPQTFQAIFPPLSLLPSSKVLSATQIDKKNTAGFLFSGTSSIPGTKLKLGILLSGRSFETFMDRVKRHIKIMLSLSIVFILILLSVLVTWVVQVLFRADKVRQVYLTRAARSSKMASIGKLAAGVAHEINNPLAIINEKAGLLQDLFGFLEEYKDDERLSEAVASIIKAVDRAGTITHRLLGFARETDSSLTTIRVEDVIEEVLGFVQKEVEYKLIRVDKRIGTHLPDISTDPGKLQQILLNLINNAVAAMDERGTLTVTAKNNDMEQSLEIYIQDDGCGISEENQKKIFEPFFTTKSKIGGTGLGLSLTYGLIRDLHGTLEFNSTAGIGTTFIITLPYTIDEKE